MSLAVRFTCRHHPGIQTNGNSWFGTRAEERWVQRGIASASTQRGIHSWKTQRIYYCFRSLHIHPYLRHHVENLPRRKEYNSWLPCLPEHLLVPFPWSWSADPTVNCMQSSRSNYHCTSAPQVRSLSSLLGDQQPYSASKAMEN